MNMKEEVKILFKRTHDLAKLPVKANPEPATGDSGYDVFAVEQVVIPARGSAVVPVGLQLAFITLGYWFRIEPKSGLGFKHGLQPHLGIIDNQYRGGMGIKIYNFSDVDYTYNVGDKVAQFVVYELVNSTVDWSDTVYETNRGSKGFGSTGR
jgi:dUTP pyrophosphatase